MNIHSYEQFSSDILSTCTLCANARAEHITQIQLKNISLKFNGLVLLRLMNKGREQYKNHQRHTSARITMGIGHDTEDDPSACHLNKTGKITQLSEVILIIFLMHTTSR